MEMHRNSLACTFICVMTLTAAMEASNYGLAVLDRLRNASVFDAEMVPLANGQAVKVTTSISVISMGNLDLTHMDYGIDFYLFHEWKDASYRHTSSKDITVDTELHGKIWVPDTYIVNAKESSFHNVAMQNKQMKISKDGNVQLSYKLTARPSCPLNLRSFPWDVQHCSLILESYAYSDKDVDYKWEENINNKQLFANTAENLSQYSLVGFRLEKRQSEYAIGNWSTLEVIFHLKRNSAFYLIQVLGPTILTVSISWISFIIKFDQHPARISLGITSILTMEAIHLFVQTSLPKIHYMTILDSYSFISNFFVFLAMVEYAFVLIFAEIAAKKSQNSEEHDAKRMSASMTEGTEEEHKNSKTFLNKCSTRLKGLKQRIRLVDISSKTGSEIDSVARILFPAAFILFNCIFYAYVQFAISSE